MNIFNRRIWWHSAQSV